MIVARHVQQVDRSLSAPKDRVVQPREDSMDGANPPRRARDTLFQLEITPR